MRISPRPTAARVDSVGGRGRPQVLSPPCRRPGPVAHASVRRPHASRARRATSPVSPGRQPSPGEPTKQAEPGAPRRSARAGPSVPERPGEVQRSRQGPQGPGSRGEAVDVAPIIRQEPACSSCPLELGRAAAGLVVCCTSNLEVRRMNVCWVSVLGLAMVLPTVSCGGSLGKGGGAGGVQGASGGAGAGHGTETGGGSGSAGFPGGSLDASSGSGGSGWGADGGGAMGTDGAQPAQDAAVNCSSAPPYTGPTCVAGCNDDSAIRGAACVQDSWTCAGYMDAPIDARTCPPCSLFGRVPAGCSCLSTGLSCSAHGG
jgi:hypothetical protein